jgi:hypothetical protein
VGIVPRSLLLLVALPALAAPDFGTGLYPVLETAQCRLCHSENGVASTTRLRFPPDGVAGDELQLFGLELRRFVDAAAPEQSLLLRKPTNRLSHGGGERIRPGSREEGLLREWVLHLARLPDQPVAAARQTVKTGKPALRRLTHSQYNHTVRDLLGDETRPADQFPREDFVHGFTNQAEGQSISPSLAEAYSAAAARVARNAFRGGDSRNLIGCKPSPECGEQFVRSFGRKAFRRPLEPAETARYLQLMKRQTDFFNGAQIVVEAMLQSPAFLFQTEPGAYGIASRLSFFLWDTAPDKSLSSAAERGELSTPSGIAAIARRMLADDRARDSLDEFLAQWLRFDRLRGAVRDRRIFPEFTDELVLNFTEETRRLFSNLVWNDGDFREFFTARYTFLSPALARIYDLPAPSEPWARVAFPDESPRAGILGQGSFLAVTSKPAETSPTERGLFIREHFLCQIVPPPPPGVNTTLPLVTDEKPMTNQQRLAIHLSNAACAGCHQLVDPIGFGFEKFDAIGKFRTRQVITIHPTFDEIKRKAKTEPTVHELDIDARGFVRGLKTGEFTSPRQLGEILSAEPQCHRCIVKQLFRYALGRPETEEDRQAIDIALNRYRDSRFRLKELIIAIVTSEPFIRGVEER